MRERRREREREEGRKGGREGGRQGGRITLEQCEWTVKCRREYKACEQQKVQTKRRWIITNTEPSSLSMKRGNALNQVIAHQAA